MQKGVIPSKDSILEDMKVPFSKFVLAMKLFILAVNKAYKGLGIAYNTAHKYKRKRECIYTSEDDELLGGEVEIDESKGGGCKRCFS
jgi:transposase